MNYRLQIPPVAAGCRSKHHLALREWWKGKQVNTQDAEFFRSWLVYDSDFDLGRSAGRLNWNMVLGLGLAVSVSVSFWAGAGMVLAWVWR
jgi:hypothetical protein